METALRGKIIEARTEKSADNEVVLGRRLKELRNLAGITQAELARHLGIGQAALSRLEKRKDIQVSTLRHYVEALGATLRIDASFRPETSIGLRVFGAFDLDACDDNQLVFPIIGDEDFRYNRDVVLSIKPQYSAKIISGKKTVELRRRFPVQVPNGTLAYIYSTTPDKALLGLAEIASVEKQRISRIWAEFGRQSCINRSDFDAYFTGQDYGFAVQLKGARALKRPLALSELRQRFGFEPPQSFLYAKPLLREALRHECAEIPDRH